MTGVPHTYPPDRCTCGDQPRDEPPPYGCPIHDMLNRKVMKRIFG